MLTAIKLLHTLIWAFLAASIVALPIVGVLRRFRWAAILTGLVLLECGVLALNGGRCPLSDLAARFTDDRAHNFDIYLPNCSAQHNKVILACSSSLANWSCSDTGSEESVPRHLDKRTPNLMRDNSGIIANPPSDRHHCAPSAAQLAFGAGSL